MYTNGRGAWVTRTRGGREGWRSLCVQPLLAFHGREERQTDADGAHGGRGRFRALTGSVLARRLFSTERRTGSARPITFTITPLKSQKMDRTGCIACNTKPAHDAFRDGMLLEADGNICKVPDDEQRSSIGCPGDGPSSLFLARIP